MSLKLFSNSCGMYNLSMLRIVMNVDFDFGEFSWNNNEPYQKATFVHEYIHYLQDISTTYGLLNFNNILGKIQGYMNFVANSENDEIDLPINLDYIENYEQNEWLSQVYEGDTVDLKRCKIINISYLEEELYKNEYNKDVYQVILNLRIDEEFKCKEYIFGGRAILEGMAYLIETNKYYEESSNLVAPYNLCEMVTKYIYEEFAENKSFIVALCDISLMSLQPGVTFYNILREMKESKFMPNNIEDIYTYCRNNKQLDYYMELYEEQLHTAMERIDFMYSQNSQVSDMVNINKWLKSLLERMKKDRSKNCAFITQIMNYKGEKFEKYFLGMVHKYGVPLIVTKDKEILNGATVSNPDLNLTFMNVPIILDKLFDYREKDNECELINLCKEYESQTDIQLVDNNCIVAPWEKAKEDILCPVGLVWYQKCLQGKSLRRKI